MIRRGASAKENKSTEHQVSVSENHLKRGVMWGGAS